MAGIVASMHFAKAAPIMDAVGHDLGLGLLQSAWAVSVLGLVGVVFAIAAGAVVAAIGLQRGLAIGLFGGALLAGLVSLAPHGALFLVGRFFEGFSHLLIVICAPALMAAQANARDRPLAMALWGCFFGVGFAITSAVAPHVLPLLGWRGFLAAHAALMLLVGVLVWQALRAQEPGTHTSTNTRARSTNNPWPTLRQVLATHGAVYTSGAPLLLALCFCAYAALFLAVLTFLGRYLPQVHGFSSAASGQWVALLSIVTLGFTLLAGVLVRAGVRLRTGLGAAFAGIGVAALLVFGMQLATAPTLALLVLMMAGFGLVPGFVFANVPRVAPAPERAALAYGAIAQFGNVGTFAGTPAFASAYTVAGWRGGAAYVCVVAVLGLLLTLALHRQLGADE